MTPSQKFDGDPAPLDEALFSWSVDDEDIPVVPDWAECEECGDPMIDHEVIPNPNANGELRRGCDGTIVKMGE